MLVCVNLPVAQKENKMTTSNGNCSSLSPIRSDMLSIAHTRRNKNSGQPKAEGKDVSLMSRAGGQDHVKVVDLDEQI